MHFSDYHPKSDIYSIGYVVLIRSWSILYSHQGVKILQCFFFCVLAPHSLTTSALDLCLDTFPVWGAVSFSHNIAEMREARANTHTPAHFNLTKGKLTRMQFWHPCVTPQKTNRWNVVQQKQVQQTHEILCSQFKWTQTAMELGMASCHV